MSAAQSLWPEPPRVRPLRYKEEPVSGQRVYVTGIEGIWRFHSWCHMGRDRWAMLDCSDLSCRSKHLASEERIRIDA